MQDLQLQEGRVTVHHQRRTAGHRHVSSTEAYRQQVIDDLQADVKKFHPF